MSFGSVKSELQALFGRLTSTPAASLLLYLSLALDFADRRLEAQQVTLDLLATRSPAGSSPWSRRQYAALLHLYVFEVLLPELHEPAQAARWLRESALPIPAALRASLAA
ncbi:hypothetical protein APUTEX25_001811, partial [Auxenochlorella protothecoides]